MRIFVEHDIVRFKFQQQVLNAALQDEVDVGNEDRQLQILQQRAQPEEAHRLKMSDWTCTEAFGRRIVALRFDTLGIKLVSSEYQLIAGDTHRLGHLAQIFCPPDDMEDYHTGHIAML